MRQLELVSKLLGKQKLANCEVYIQLDKVWFRTQPTYMIYCIDCISRPEETGFYTYDAQTEQFQKYMNTILLPTSSLVTLRDQTSWIRNTVRLAPVVIAQHLEQNPEFQAMINLKSKDGIQYYHLYDENGFMYKFPMFSGLIKMNKSDEIDIIIHDCNSVYYLYNAHVYRKNCNMYQDNYFWTLKLGG